VTLDFGVGEERREVGTGLLLTSAEARGELDPAGHRRPPRGELDPTGPRRPARCELDPAGPLRRVGEGLLNSVSFFLSTILPADYNHILEI
jgi:hypothetical protein